MTTALCPGSFDPPTNGHIDIIRRTAALHDRVVVAVVANPTKQPLFTAEERIEMFRATLGPMPAVEYATFDGLLVAFAGRVGADVIVKGLRGAIDFDYELQMAQMNREVGGIETMFVPTSPEWAFVSSSLVREVATLGGDVDRLVPDVVAAALQERFS